MQDKRMNMYMEQATCTCGNISAEILLTCDLSSYIPRECDCDFCTKYVAAYISDPAGKLDIKIVNSDQTATYMQGDNLAKLLVCTKCDVLVSVTYTENRKTFGALNSKTLENQEQLSISQRASPKLLSSTEKKKRWREIWFSDVTIGANSA